MMISIPKPKSRNGSVNLLLQQSALSLRQTEFLA
jgi:hypothetical protein